MQIRDTACNWARGTVTSQLINVKTGEAFGPARRSNVITYSAADTMARMVGGYSDYIPRYMGFIYGTNAAAVFADPSLTRQHTWAGIATELAGITGKANVLISPITSNPALSVTGSTTYYSANTVALQGKTSARTEYGFDTTGSTYASALQDDGSDVMFQALLLTRLVSTSGITYIPFARVSLAVSGTYQTKPAGFELGIDWQVDFN